jgi:hypothetical protein
MRKGELMSFKEIMAIRVPKTTLLGVMFLLNIASGSKRSQAQTLPGTLTYSWVGNSFMDHNARAWVPDEVRDLCVDSNGTVFTPRESKVVDSHMSTNMDVNDST